jgi:hypothetical protein
MFATELEMERGEDGEFVWLYIDSAERIGFITLLERRFEVPFVEDVSSGVVSRFASFYPHGPMRTKI